MELQYILPPKLKIIRIMILKLIFIHLVIYFNLFILILGLILFELSMQFKTSHEKLLHFKKLNEDRELPENFIKNFGPEAQLIL